MGWILNLTRVVHLVLIGIFGTKEEPGSVSEYDGNKGARKLDIAIYQSISLTEKNKRYAEQNVVKFLGQALEHAGYNYRIKSLFNPVDGPNGSSVDHLREWKSIGGVGVDGNILLTDRNGGGRAYLGGRYGIAPGGNISRYVQLVKTAPDNEPRIYTNIRASLHENGHLLGGRHSDNMLNPPSMLYTESGIASFDRPAP